MWSGDHPNISPDKSGHLPSPASDVDGLGVVGRCPCRLPFIANMPTACTVWLLQFLHPSQPTHPAQPLSRPA